LHWRGQRTRNHAVYTRDQGVRNAVVGVGERLVSDSVPHVEICGSLRRVVPIVVVVVVVVVLLLRLATRDHFLVLDRISRSITSLHY
jgi:hypothetical protein